MSEGIEDPKEAAVRALLFAPSSKSKPRSLNSSNNGNNSNNGSPTSSTPPSPHTISPLSLSSGSTPTSLRAKSDIQNSPGLGRRFRGEDEPVMITTTAPSSSSSSTSSSSSHEPPKWSQRHLHHHLPSSSSSAASSALPSPSISPAASPAHRLSSTSSSNTSATVDAAREELLRGSSKDKEKEKDVLRDSGIVKRGSRGDQDQTDASIKRRLSTKNLMADYGDEETLRQKLSQLKDKRKKSIYSSQQMDQMLSISMEDLNITGDSINLDELETFLKESQEDNSVKEALMQGVELKEYSQKIEAELKESERAIVPVYIELRNEIGELHSKVGGCVEILGAFEKLLTSFQADLSNISDDIKNMQDQSMEKNVKINNRKGVITKLDRFIEDLSLPPSYVEQLEKAPIDMTYLQLLASFNRKMGFVSMQKTKGVIAIEDMYRKFNIVLDRVVARVHKYTVHQTATIKSFAQLRETQEELSSMSFLYQFLFIHAPDNARDVKAAYMDTCDKFYTHYYKSYVSAMSKLHVDIATKNDVIGIEDSKLRGFFSSKLTKNTAKGSVFALGTRGTLIENPEDPPIDAAVSPSSNTVKYSYDELFRSMLKLLVDQVNCEFFFVRDFFLSDDDVTFGIFPRCAELLVESVENYATNSYDAVGLLVVLCLIDRFSEIIPGNLEHLLNSLQKITNVVFTRFVYVFELNVASIKSANPQDLGPIDIRTHYVTRRYGEFAASILTLYGPLPDPLRDGIAACMAKIRDAMLKLLHQLSLELKDKKDQTVFLINNYDLILSLIRIKGVNAEEVGELASAMEKSEKQFVALQIQMTPHVSQLQSFVNDIQPLFDSLPSSSVDDSTINHPKFSKEVVEAIMKQFAQHWKEGVAGWNAEIPKLFTNFKVGLRLFMMVADQMFSYYKQFSNIMGRSFKMLKTTKYFVSETEIIRELRGYEKKYEDLGLYNYNV